MTINEMIEKQGYAMDMTIYHISERLKNTNIPALEKAHLEGYITAMVHIKEALKQFEEKKTDGKIIL
jgi:hypothetical protein